MPLLKYSALGLLFCLPISAFAQQPLTSFNELVGAWVNGNGAELRIDNHGRISTFTGGKGLSGRTYVGATSGGGNFAFITDSGASVWDVVETSGTHSCPRGVFMKSH